MDRERYEALLADANKTNQDLGWRLHLAQAFGSLMVRAYDALQAYGIDYRKLRTYTLWEKLLPEGATFDNPSARQAISNWITRCSHDLDAAIKRKLNLKLAYEQEPDPDNGI